MLKTIAAIAIGLLCAANANAKSLKFTDQELQKGAACLAEINRAAQSAKEAAPFDANGNPHTPTGKYELHNHAKCEDWDDYVKQKYPNPSGN